MTNTDRFIARASLSLTLFPCYQKGFKSRKIGQGWSGMRGVWKLDETMENKLCKVNMESRR